MISETIADMNEPTAIPDNSRVVIGTCPPTRARLYTTYTVINAPTNAKSDTELMSNN
jgi:hypothetical protein